MGLLNTLILDLPVLENGSIRFGFPQAEDMVRVYPPFVNYFEMTNETVARCDRDVPRFHAFLKVKRVIPTNEPAHSLPVLITVSQHQVNVFLVSFICSMIHSIIYC